MLEKILRILEKFIPKKLYKFFQPIYHFLLALIGIIIYRFPAFGMTIIGVTGTKGKTSTANFIHSVLNEKEKTGLITTANMKIGNKERPNRYHMSMPGRFTLQKFLREMKDANCKYVIVEVTSEGIKQFRHLGLFLSVSIFTNLSPEHLASHNNSYEKYRDTKAKIFKNNFLQKIFNKKLKYILINTDDENAKYFKSHVDKSIKELDFSLNQASNILEGDTGISFNIKEDNYYINILGKFNIYNSLPAIILGKKFGLNIDEIKEGLEKMNLIPGRMEEIKEGQNFRVFVDYAHEKLSMNNLLDTARNLALDKKIIIVLGGDGGGRDKQRLLDMGEIVGEKADIVIVSNSDPYFDDDMKLAKTIGDEAEKFGKIYNQNMFIILDRKEAVKKACELAKNGDIVLLTTRGSLTTMSIKGQKIRSDDRLLAKEALQNLNKN